jgi:hypothetical protein
VAAVVWMVSSNVRRMGGGLWAHFAELVRPSGSFQRRATMIIQMKFSAATTHAVMKTRHKPGALYVHQDDWTDKNRDLESREAESEGKLRPAPQSGPLLVADAGADKDGLKNDKKNPTHSSETSAKFFQLPVGINSVQL